VVSKWYAPIGHGHDETAVPQGIVVTTVDTEAKKVGDGSTVWTHRLSSLENGRREPTGRSRGVE
jgi:hypothetical protein